MEIYQGRPETNEGRLQKEIAVYDLLDELQISYERVDHPGLRTARKWIRRCISRSARICFCAIIRKRIFIF